MQTHLEQLWILDAFTNKRPYQLYGKALCLSFLAGKCFCWEPLKAQSPLHNRGLWAIWRVFERVEVIAAFCVGLGLNKRLEGLPIYESRARLLGKILYFCRSCF